ncbi:unnamed protein product [Adineta steineri]|uniref:Ras-associating domain-containing protein n=1 Tax=Adineta steineri TaxID=433720 RepID=A0A815ICD0_9BILA|nr:unnamed protein product [Adineta steineri]
MELETEIPIWYKGKVKWISNLTSRSTCSDVIQAILSSLSIDYSSFELNENYILYECWRGVERPLKYRCRLLKLWNSWAGECENVILTLRSREEESIPTHILIRQQEKKLNKLKRQLRRTDKQIQYLNKYENEKEILIYFNLSRSIIHLNNQIKNQEKIIFNLKFHIENENENNQENFLQDDFKKLLYDVNQTLITSRKLTLLADKIDQQIQKTNDQIEKKLLLLDELELDYALQDNIDIDSLEDQDEQISSSPLFSIKTLTVQSRPTAIVEPSPSRLKSKEFLGNNLISHLSLDNLDKQEKNCLNTTKSKIDLIPLSIPYQNYKFQTINNDESDTGISSIYSNDEQLVTLV